MGAGIDLNQKTKTMNKSQEIYTGTGQITQNQASSAMQQKNVKTEEKTSVVDKLFEVEGETVENIAALKTEETDKQSVTSKQSRIQPVNGVPDALVEQRQKSIVHGTSMSGGEKKQYIREADNWKDERQNSFRANFVQGLQERNANLIRLTNLMTGDERSASQSYEKVRTSMEIFTDLFSMIGTQKEGEAEQDFKDQFAFAYQSALDCVEEYLQSHASTRLTYKGWQRKKWVKQLQKALNEYVGYATEIISGNIDLSQFRDQQEQEPTEVNEQLEINEHAEKERESEHVEVQKRQQEQVNGQPEAMLSVRDCYQSMLRDTRDSDEYYEGLKRMLGEFLQENEHAPKNRVHFVNLYWAIRHTLLNYDSGIEETMAYQDAKKKMPAERRALCKNLMDQLEIMQIQMIDDGVMNPEETEDELPVMERSIEFISEGKTKTRIPLEVQRCGNKKELKKYLNTLKDLTEQDKAHLRNRIRICERIEALEKTKKKVIPPACTVYRNGKKLSPDQQANRETDKFILEDVVQAHFQTHTNSCWSAVLENLLRQRGMFIHQADIRGYRDSELSDFELEKLAGDREYDMTQVRHLVGRLMKNTAFNSFQLGAPIYGADQADQQTDADRIFGEQLKERLRTAIIDKRSAVGINLSEHYLTFVGIEGDRLYYKNSKSHNEEGYPKIDTNKTYVMSVSELIEKAKERPIPGGVDTRFYAINLLWLEDLPENADLATMYGNKLDDNAFMYDDGKEYKVSSGSSDDAPEDRTMLTLNLKRDQSLKESIIANEIAFVPRFKS